MNIKKKKKKNPDPSGPQFPYLSQSWCHIYKNNTLLLHKTTIRIKYDDSFTPCLVFTNILYLYSHDTSSAIEPKETSVPHHLLLNSYSMYFNSQILFATDYTLTYTNLWVLTV